VVFMWSETHRRITLFVANLLGIDSNLARTIAYYVEAPDRERVRKPIKHHDPPKEYIRALCRKARSIFLKYWRQCVENQRPLEYCNKLLTSFANRCGEALHLVQDAVIPSPSTDRELHDFIERRCSKLDPRINLARIACTGIECVDYVLHNLKKASSAEEAIDRATSLSFVLLASMLANPYPPPELVRDICIHRARIRRAMPSMLILSSTLILLSMFVAITTQSIFAFIALLLTLPIAVLELAQIVVDNALASLKLEFASIVMMYTSLFAMSILALSLLPLASLLIVLVSKLVLILLNAKDLKQLLYHSSWYLERVHC